MEKQEKEKPEKIGLETWQLVDLLLNIVVKLIGIPVAIIQIIINYEKVMGVLGG